MRTTRDEQTQTHGRTVANLGVVLQAAGRANLAFRANHVTFATRWAVINTPSGPAFAHPELSHSTWRNQTKLFVRPG